MASKYVSSGGVDVTRNERVATPSQIGLIAVLAAVVAIVVNVVIRIVAVEVFGASSDDDPMVWGMIVAASIVATVVAAIIYWLLGRFSRRPITYFRIIAAVTLLVSLAGPLTLSDVDDASIVAGVVMHIATAIVIVGCLTMTAGTERDARSH